MGETWVVNASPVITLAKIGQLRLLESLAEEVLLPDAVAAEILAGPADDPARVAVTQGWGRRRSPTRIPEAVIEWGLGAGETAVLALAMELQSATAVLDDAAARAAAGALDVTRLGTLAVIIRAKLRGQISTAAPVIGALRAAGLRLDDPVIRSALRQIGEDWES